ncbi:MAG TPA: tetratricopeptide repeat protein [Polyangiaceae bacterium]|nr:tetratricopeptide repeat protein [Polyangiaceae bacterium]
MRSGSRWLLRLFGLSCGVGLWLVTAAASAQVLAPSVDVAPTAESGARPHFDRALELYRAGRYADALRELEAAAKLDPGGKDLFFNMSLVHEKLGQLPEAIVALERFRELETDAAERERARLTLERLNGARANQAAARPASTPCPAPPAAPAPRQGRPTAVLVGSASVAVVSLVVGAIFGAKALADDVGDTGTSASLSIAQLRERGRRAEREALVADIALALGAASAGTFAGVWLLSPGDSERRSAGITLRSYF